MAHEQKKELTVEEFFSTTRRWAKEAGRKMRIDGDFVLFYTPQCWECGKTKQKGKIKAGEENLAVATLKKCARCREAYYCGVECQRKHWPVHKKDCKKKSI